jgi:hypothetical protein
MFSTRPGLASAFFKWIAAAVAAYSAWRWAFPAWMRQCEAADARLG